MMNSQRSVSRGETKEGFYQYRINEAAKALGVSRKTIMAEIHAGNIRTVPLIQNDFDSEQRVTHAELMRYVSEKMTVIETKVNRILERLKVA